MDPIAPTAYHNLPPSPSPSVAFNNTSHTMHHRMMMHMTFYWGKSALVLFQGWPGTNSGMYYLSLIFVFVMALVLEWLSHSTLLKPGSNRVAAGLFQTLLYAIRSGISYMVMLAVMSFNGGIFIAAIVGHALGFLVFGSRVFRKGSDKPSDLPTMTC